MTRISAEWLNGPSKQVCAMLTDAGYQAWFVGGCVRNALIDAPVSDLDISTVGLTRLSAGQVGRHRAGVVATAVTVGPRLVGRQAGEN